MTDSGKIANRYPLTDYSDPANFPMPFPSTTSPILYSHGKLLIPCTTTLYQSDYRNYPSSLSVDLTTKKVQFLSLFPELYSKAHWGPKFKYESGMAYNPATVELVLNYPVDPFIQSVNLQTKEVSQHFVGSEHFEAIPPFKQDRHWVKYAASLYYLRSHKQIGTIQKPFEMVKQALLQE
jgi:hypothetical protein